MMGPRKSRIPPARESALIKVKQQIAPSFSQLITASLSPGWIPAFSLKSFGSTIWPRSSTLTRDSTLQQLFPPPSVQPIFLFIEISPLDSTFHPDAKFSQNIKIILYNLINQLFLINLIFQNLFVKLFLKEDAFLFERAD